MSKNKKSYLESLLPRFRGDAEEKPDEPAGITESTRKQIKKDFEDQPVEATDRDFNRGFEAGIDEPAPKAPAIIIAQPGDVKKLVESLKLEEGYAEALNTQKVFQLLRTGEKAPDFGRVLKTFTPEMLAAAQKFQNPGLRLITKDRSFDDLVVAMDAHKIVSNGQNDTYVGEIYKKHASRKPENWGAHIIEAPIEVKVQDFDDANLVLRERLKRFSEYKKSAKVGGMDRLKYAHTMMQALKEGRPIDDKLWTMLDEDPALLNYRVLVAGWSKRPELRRVTFTWGLSEKRSGIAHFRRSVGGEVQTS